MLKIKIKNKENADPHFLKNGIMMYFIKDGVFVFANKEADTNIRESIANIRRNLKDRKTQVEYLPVVVNFAILKRGITKNNIEEYYNGKINDMNMESTEFFKDMVDGQILGIRHAKSKGVMDAKDALVKSWVKYQGTAKNLGIFSAFV